MEGQSQARKYPCMLIKGDRLSSLTHEKPALKQNLVSLWGSELGMNVGWENHYAVIFEDAEQERIIGLAKLIQFQTGKGVLVGVVHDVIVDEDFRGRGLGKCLLGLLMQYGKDQGFYYLELTSRPARKAANGLYKKMGFTLVAKACDGGTNLYRYFF